jgi:hypothetical protein
MDRAADMDRDIRRRLLRTNRYDHRPRVELPLQIGLLFLKSFESLFKRLLLFVRGSRRGGLSGWIVILRKELDRVGDYMPIGIIIADNHKAGTIFLKTEFAQGMPQTFF